MRPTISKWPYPIFDTDSALLVGKIEEPENDISLEQLKLKYKILAARCIMKENELHQLKKERSEFSRAFNNYVVF